MTQGRKAAHRGDAFSRALAVAAGSALLGLSGPAAQAASSCPIPLSRQIESIRAFAEMMPVFRHARCMNCHGGLDPMSDRHPGADQIEPDSSIEQCQNCHDGLPGWSQPGNPLFFVNKSDTELCLQMKEFERTGHEFVEHIRIDHGPDNVQFIAAAFAGDRALGEGLRDYGLVVEKPPGTQAELTARAHKWVEILGDGYESSRECGCTLKLEGKFTQTEKQTQGGGMPVADILQTTTIDGKLVWTEKDDGLPQQPTFDDVPSKFYAPTDGEISVAFEYDAKGALMSCRFEGSRTFPIKELPERARRHLLLEIAADGRYKMSLGMVAGELPIPIVNKGCRWTILPISVDDMWRDASVVIGWQRGVITENSIDGQLSPMVVGSSTTTGSWAFVPSQN